MIFQAINETVKQIISSLNIGEIFFEGQRYKFIKIFIGIDESFKSAFGSSETINAGDFFFVGIFRFATWFAFKAPYDGIIVLEGFGTIAGNDYFFVIRIIHPQICGTNQVKRLRLNRRL